ncbi:MAG: hypothetical protein R2838_09690 [Caldilineaceae bacterium]
MHGAEDINDLRSPPSIVSRNSLVIEKGNTTSESMSSGASALNGLTAMRSTLEIVDYH